MNPYQGLKQSKLESSLKASGLTINLNPYQGLKLNSLNHCSLLQAYNQLESLSGIETTEILEKLEELTYNQLESLSGIETCLSLNQQGIPKLTINLNPYQGLKHFIRSLPSRKNPTYNQLESLSGIETYEPEYGKIVATGLTINLNPYQGLKQLNLDSLGLLGKLSTYNQLESLSGIETPHSEKLRGWC